jgi:hypothetical protein
MTSKKLIFILSFSILIISACEKTEDDKIAQAQECLDRAVLPTDATACLTMISGINTLNANRIRCSLSVLESGTTQDVIISAYQAMDAAGGHGPLIELATVLGLGDVVPNGTVDAADEAVAANIKSICDQTDSAGLKTVGNLILFGTRAQVQADILGDPENSGDVATSIATMSDADAGSFGNDVFATYCVPTFSNEDICSPLSFAGAGSEDDNTVGSNLKTCLALNHCY